MANPNYAEIAKQAEAAVASIKDSDLRGIAFGKILDTLLGQGGQEKTSARGYASKAAAVSSSRQGKEGAQKSSKKKGGPKGYVEELIEDNFFKTQKTLAAVRAELGNRGHHIPVTSLSAPMMTLCKERQLRRQKTKEGKKEIYTYSRW